MHSCIQHTLARNSRHPMPIERTLLAAVNLIAFLALFVSCLWRFLVEGQAHDQKYLFDLHSLAEKEILKVDPEADLIISCDI